MTLSIIRFLTVKYKKLDTKNEYFKKEKDEKTRKKISKKGSSSLNKLSLFQKPEGRFNKSCPLSSKNAPVIDYKNVSLLKNIFQRIVKFFHQK